jgi:hypothetical protein
VLCFKVTVCRLGFRGPTGIHVDGSSLKTTKQAGILGHCQRALPVATNTNRRLPASFRNAREIEGLLGISRKTRVHNDHERKPMNAFAATKNLTVGMHSHHADHLTPHTLKRKSYYRLSTPRGEVDLRNFRSEPLRCSCTTVCKASSYP